MSIADYYEGGETKQNKSHLENLIAVAMEDGVIADSELNLLKRFAVKLSIDNTHFEEMLQGVDRYEMNPPVGKEERYKRLYNLVDIAMVDGMLEKDELTLVSKYAIGLGYSEKDADELIGKTLKFIANKVGFEQAYEKL